MNGEIIMKEIKRFVLTGGPSSGKSQSMPHIKAHLEANGYKVICIDETSTQIINSNIHWRDENVDAMTYQKAIFKMQKSKEDVFEEVAKGINYDKVVILCDRGLLDGKAYIDEAKFHIIAGMNGIASEKEMLDRYDMVLYLDTTAGKVTMTYGNENNKARTATSTEAQLFGQRVRSAWSKHPSLVDIPCTPRFEDKVSLICSHIDNHLNIKTPPIVGPVKE